MDTIEFEKLAVLVPERLEFSTLIIPRAADNAGNFTFSNSDLKTKSLEVAVLSCSKKVFDIPPYFPNTEFTVVRCVVISPEFLEEYGGLATEICELRLVGKSKDVFERNLGKLVKSRVVDSLRSNKPHDVNSLFPFGLKLNMIAEINKDSKRYFSVSSEIYHISKLSQNFGIDWEYLCDTVKAMESAESVPALNSSLGF